MTKQKQYIDRTALLRQAETLFDGQREVMGVKAEHIYSAPLEDVAKVVHGEWLRISDDDDADEGEYYCSVCCAEEFIPDCAPFPPFCWNCGAKMDGGTHDKTK